MDKQSSQTTFQQSPSQMSILDVVDVVIPKIHITEFKHMPIKQFIKKDNWCHRHNKEVTFCLLAEDN
jgi:hypothetical protein